MHEVINWSNDVARAQLEGSRKGKPLLLSFTSPDCSFSQRMEAVSYAQPDANRLLQAGLIPVRITPENPFPFKTYSVKATPHHLMTGEGGFELRSFTGFMDGPELLAFLLLGIAKHWFDKGRFQKALEAVDELIRKTPRAETLPEALFLRGFFLYKMTSDHRRLKNAFHELESSFPGNDWTKTARMVALFHYAASVWEWSQKKGNINKARFGVILHSPQEMQ